MFNKHWYKIFVKHQKMVKWRMDYYSVKRKEKNRIYIY